MRRWAPSSNWVAAPPVDDSLVDVKVEVVDHVLDHAQRVFEADGEAQPVGGPGEPLIVVELSAAEGGGGHVNARASSPPGGIDSAFKRGAVLNMIEAPGTPSPSRHSRCRARRCWRRLLGRGRGDKERRSPGRPGSWGNQWRDTENLAEIRFRLKSGSG